MWWAFVRKLRMGGYFRKERKKLSTDAHDILHSHSHLMWVRTFILLKIALTLRKIYCPETRNAEGHTTI